MFYSTPTTEYGSILLARHSNTFQFYLSDNSLIYIIGLRYFTTILIIIQINYFRIFLNFEVNYIIFQVGDII